MRGASMRQFDVHDDLVFQKSRGVENGLFDVLCGEIGPSADDVVTGRSAGDELQDELDADPCTANAWFPAEHGSVGYDALEHDSPSGDHIANGRRADTSASRYPSRFFPTGYASRLRGRRRNRCRRATSRRLGTRASRSTL